MSKSPVVDRVWVASRYGTGLGLAVLLFLNYFLTGFISGGPNVNGLNQHVIDAIFGALAGGIVVGFGLVYRVRQKFSVVRNVTAWTTAAVATSFAMAPIVSAISGQPQSVSLIDQRPFAMTSLLASCFAFTLLLAAINEGRGNLATLRQKQRELFSSTIDSASQLDAFANRLQTPVKARLVELVESVRSQVASSLPRQLADRLFEFLNTDLRELLSDIGHTEQSALQTTARSSRAINSKVQISKSVSRVSFGQSLNLFVALTLPALYFVPSMWLLGGWAGASAEASVLASAGLLWLLLTKVLENRQQHWVVWALLNGLIFGCASLPLSLLATVLGSSLDSDLAQATAISTALIAVGASSLESLIVRRGQVQAETERMNVALRASLAVMNERLSLLRKNVARHFHNNVQSKIVALALRLSGQSSLNEAELASTLSELDAIVAAMQLEASKVTPIETQMATAQLFWAGALEVSVLVEPAAASIVDSRAELNSRVSEVLREGLTNAAKYSTDGKVKVALHSLDATRVQLVMTNRRFDQLDNMRPGGVGSELIGEAANGWSGSRVGDNFVLEAVFE